ncbi:hypothetical protein BZG02_08440 [Labilibaculum filiforme]|uniref:Metal-binding protein n=1 Tax=Labilibaculum filiforme TaxID=1940526 RepID=A0A2N3HZB5_9BACT|nr:DUF1847 domain-containing protein [Labilibaculum filiforme]PKQ63405.1 hypothetical protein BZG02_08440 [Labilibaculum filiforme]
MDDKDLYSDHDISIMKNAADSLNRNNDRIQEIIEFAKISNIKIIGIAHCTTFTKQANQLRTFLELAGFTVEQVNCKIGKVPFSDLVPNYKGISCNPAGQAHYLEEKNTELNIMMGLCLGHDLIFNAKSKAPVTPLIVKDRKLNHHSIEKLDSSDS